MTRIERHPELPREFGVGPLAVGCSGFCLDRIYVANDGAKTEGCHVRGELHMLEWVGSYRITSHTTENDAAAVGHRHQCSNSTRLEITHSKPLQPTQLAPWTPPPTSLAVRRLDGLATGVVEFRVGIDFGTTHDLVQSGVMKVMWRLVLFMRYLPLKEL